MSVTSGNLIAATPAKLATPDTVMSKRDWSLGPWSEGNIRAGIEDLLDGKVESATAGEQRPRPQMAVGAHVIGLAHEDSG